MNRVYIKAPAASTRLHSFAFLFSLILPIMPFVYSVLILAANQTNKNLAVSCKTAVKALLFLTTIAN